MGIRMKTLGVVDRFALRPESVPGSDARRHHAGVDDGTREHANDRTMRDGRTARRAAGRHVLGDIDGVSVAYGRYAKGTVIRAWWP